MTYRNRLYVPFAFCIFPVISQTLSCLVCNLLAHEELNSTFSAGSRQFHRNVPQETPDSEVTCPGDGCSDSQGLEAKPRGFQAGKRIPVSRPKKQSASPTVGKALQGGGAAFITEGFALVLEVV